MKKQTIKDHNFSKQRVLLRVDYNVPILNGVIQDNHRIVQTLPTLKALLNQGASLILMSHLGRPDTLKSSRETELSLRPVAKELEKLLEIKVNFCEEIIGDQVLEKAKSLKPGEILLLENVRYYRAETDKKDPEGMKAFAKSLASLGDVFVNDAFGTAHREHASTCTIANFLPSYAGLLMEKELDYLGRVLENPQRPMVSILGGAKISSKIPLIKNLIPRADKILVGGGMAYTFFKAMNLEIGQSLLEVKLLEECKEIMRMGKGIIELPSDVMVGKIDFKKMEAIGKLHPVLKEEIPIDLEGLDIASATIDHFKKIILSAKTIIWNGPMGVFECQDAAKGTLAIAQALVKATELGATTIIGGGDSASAIKQMGLQDKITHLSTGGGASLEFLEGKILPGIDILSNKK